jgi:hypothetical protein
MENRFDAAAKALAAGDAEEATGVSRREALRKVGLGLAGALLASLGMGGAWAKGGGGTSAACRTYCQRFRAGAERNRCLQVCQSCPSTLMLCGPDAFNLVCCGGACCGGLCVSLASDPNNCGACGHSCGSFPNVVTTCSAGTCAYACAAGWADCDRVAANGCETDVTGDALNCGACGQVCATGLFCCGGACSELATDPNNCGSCYNICDYYQAYCCGGACTDLSGDPYNCGGCGRVCPGSAPYCENGACSCPTNTFCSNGDCVDLNYDRNNCGACGNVCPDATPVCSNGVCSPCGFPLTNCGGFCADTTSDNGNCGGCGILCTQTGYTCMAGICTQLAP